MQVDTIKVMQQVDIDFRDEISQLKGKLT